MPGSCEGGGSAAISFPALLVESSLFYAGIAAAFKKKVCKKTLQRLLPGSCEGGGSAAISFSCPARAGVPAPGLSRALPGELSVLRRKSCRFQKRVAKKLYSASCPGPAKAGALPRFRFCACPCSRPLRSAPEKLPLSKKRFAKKRYSVSCPDPAKAGVLPRFRFLLCSCGCLCSVLRRKR